MNTYDEGDLVRAAAVFTNAAGTATDPDALTFRFRSESGTTTVYTYGVNAALVRDSSGHYHVDFTVDTCGFWYYRFAGTGTGQGAGEAKLFVRESFF